MKQYKPLRPQVELASTLSRRVMQLRELRNLTVRDLAKLSRFTVKRLEEIESGLETWLSATDRQRLANALTVDPSILQDVEMRPSAGHMSESETWKKETNERLTQAILNGARELECPNCGSTLHCRVVEGIDMEERPIYFAKAMCTKCPFILR